MEAKRRNIRLGSLESGQETGIRGKIGRGFQCTLDQFGNKLPVNRPNGHFIGRTGDYLYHWIKKHNVHATITFRIEKTVKNRRFMTHYSSKTKISRRDFISRATAGTAVMLLTPFNSLLANTSQYSWPLNARKYRIRMIGHGHIDPVWLWRWHEGVSVVHSTFRSALDRMKENKEMVFTCSSALFYQWVSENDPKMLDEVRQRVKEGRWNVVGGWWVERT
jgi:hypothetical protein